VTLALGGESMSLFNKVRIQMAPARGQTMTEYSLILATIAIVIISLYNTAGTIITTLLSHVGPLL
jgi:Flp pilus assembly pilin Flp